MPRIWVGVAAAAAGVASWPLAVVVRILDRLVRALICAGASPDNFSVKMRAFCASGEW